MKQETKKNIKNYGRTTANFDWQTGVQTSADETEMKQYLEEVIKKVREQSTSRIQWNNLTISIHGQTVT